MKMFEPDMAEHWEQRTSGELYILEEAYFRHSDLFLKNHTGIQEDIRSALNGELLEQVFWSEHKNLVTPYHNARIRAIPLNKGIRNRFMHSELNIKYEVTFEDGVFDDSLRSEGFDFANIDDQYNFVNFRNLCFGRRAIFGGEELWEAKLSTNPIWRDLSNQMNINQIPNGTDMNYKKEKPTILGEIQFGNWGLVYRDILKVIKVERDEDVDLFIYIVAAGNLAEAISDGTVNFERAKEEFRDYKNILSMPIWLIGVDIR